MEIQQVYLLYEDDYGGMFSPWFLTKVFTDKQEADECRERHKWLSTVRTHEYKGTLDPAAYPQTIGGLFSND